MTNFNPMIKKIFILLMVILGWSAETLAQAAILPKIKYSFQLDSATYQPLVSPISLNNGAVWSSNSTRASITLPFQIAISGSRSNSIFVSFPLVAVSLFDQNTPHIIDHLFPIRTNAAWTDRGSAIDSNLSPVSYVINGVVGNRILKIEWKDIGSIYEVSANNGILANYISLQVWFYEGSQIIEYRYGPRNLTDPNLFYGGVTSGPLVGFESHVFTLDEVIYLANILSGTATAPSLRRTYQWLNGTPSNGTVYRFIPINPTTSLVEKQISSSLKAYPNPATDFLQLELKDNHVPALVQLLDLTGREVKRIQLTEMKQRLDISDLAAGVYNLRMQGTAGSLKLIKK